MTVKELKSILLSGNVDNRKIDFFEFAESYLENVNSEAHKRNLASFISILKAYAGEKLDVSQITFQFLLRFEHYLRRKGVRNGINNYMRYFRALFNKARDYHNDEDAGIILNPHYTFRK